MPTRKVETYQIKKEKIGSADGTFFVCTRYVSTFPVRILPEKQTAAEFLNNSKWIPMPSDFSSRNSLRIPREGFFGIFYVFNKLLFAWFVSFHFIRCKDIDPNQTNINVSFFQWIWPNLCVLSITFEHNDYFLEYSTITCT